MPIVIPAGVGIATLWAFCALLPGAVRAGVVAEVNAVVPGVAPAVAPRTPHESDPVDVWMPRQTFALPDVVDRCEPVVRGSYQSIQVNVDARGCNIAGDAANEPSIAVDPTDPRKIVIGWRQFDTVESYFRQAGWAYSHDAGHSWTFPGVLAPGLFGSDPVLGADADGNFYYHSIRDAWSNSGDLYKSLDGGVSWRGPVLSGAGDKPWMVIDKTSGIGRGNVYVTWSGQLLRSIDGGETFEAPLMMPGSARWGTMSVGPLGELYVVGFYGEIVISQNAQDAGAVPTFFATLVHQCPDCGGGAAAVQEAAQTPHGVKPDPNPGGIPGQPWIATDHSDGPSRGNVYLLRRVRCAECERHYLMFSRSTDGGETWEYATPVTDEVGEGEVWQWFAMMSVAPDGRIDVVWNDTRNTGAANLSELFYTYSTDAGDTWSRNIPVSPVFDSHIGWPEQYKLGDYYHMLSDNVGVNVAYAATFNGEHDVYYLRIGAYDCNNNEVPDETDIRRGTSLDCGDNGVPDECEEDCNDNGRPDACDIQTGESRDEDDNGVPDECENLLLYVDSRAPGDNDGSSWTNAFRDLQDALGVAMAGHVSEIWVAAGTYRPDRTTGNQRVSFRLVNGVTLYGGFVGDEGALGQRDIEANATILSGDLNGDDRAEFTNYDDNSYHVVIGSATDETAVLDGFTITGGNAPGFDPYSVSDSDATGGGMLILAGDPTVRNCVFVRNQATPYGGWGGAMFNRDANPTLVNCTFRENAAYEGGGIYIDRSSPHLTGCTFEENVARSGGAVVIDEESAPVFSQCTIRANTAPYGKGGVMVWGGTPTLIDCRFTANEGAIFNSNYSSGDHLLLVNCTFERNLGALYHEGLSATLVGCVFDGNVRHKGAAVYNRGRNLTLINCVLSHNIATDRGGGIASERGYDLEIANSILWANEDSTGSGFSAQLFGGDQLVPESWHVHHNCVQGWTDDLPGEGNISADPRFVDILGPDGAAGTKDDDLRLLPDSPCIDAGDNGAVPPDAADLDGDTATNEPVPIDLAGKPRFVDAMATVDVGSGTRPIVDMGAFEFAADCNANGFSDEEDIAVVRSADCNRNAVPDECEADCNANLVVDECDILSGFSMDCTANNMPDECEPDCNGNGQADSCDLASGSSSDCNDTHIPDECEPDCNGNGQPDDCDVQDELSPDCNQNDLPDECDVDSGVSADCNENGHPDECEDDCNGNSVPDDCDLAYRTSLDVNGNDLPDECDVLRYVDRRAEGLNTGLSWSDAYSDLQYAFSEMADLPKGVAMIWVAKGIYTPSAVAGDRAVTFQPPGGVTVYGGFAGNEKSLEERDPRRHETILSCDLRGNDGVDFSYYRDNCYHVVTACNTEPGITLDALVIRGGNADIVGGDNTRDRGAGVFVENAEIELRNCVIKENFNAGSGAVWLNSSNARLHECVFDNNRSDRPGTSAIHNVFESNLTIDRSTIHGGHGRYAIFNGPQSTVAIANTQFSGNSPGTVVRNMGLAFIENCTFSNNGGSPATATLVGPGAATVVNTIFWNEDPTENALEPAGIDMGNPLTSVSYSCVQAGWTGEGIGNISLDPHFVDPLGADGALGTGDENLRLTADSLCIDAGDPEFTPQPGETDYAGHPRVLCGRVDIGAYEFGIGDFDCDTAVDITDFAAWDNCMTGPDEGPYDLECVPFDFDADNDIDFRDFSGFQATFPVR